MSKSSGTKTPRFLNGGGDSSKSRTRIAKLRGFSIAWLHAVLRIYSASNRSDRAPLETGGGEEAHRAVSVFVHVSAPSASMSAA